MRSSGHASRSRVQVETRSSSSPSTVLPHDQYPGLGPGLAKGFPAFVQWTGGWQICLEVPAQENAGRPQVPEGLRRHLIPGRHGSQAARSGPQPGPTPVQAPLCQAPIDDYSGNPPHRKFADQVGPQFRFQGNEGARG